MAERSFACAERANGPRIPTLPFRAHGCVKRRGLPRRRTARARRARPGASGAILRALPDPHHYLTFGYTDDTPVLVSSNLAFEPSSSIASPLRFASHERLRLSGFAYQDSLQRLAGTPYVMDERLGDGHIVLFLDDPNFRVYWRGLSRLFLDALLLSPSF